MKDLSFIDINPGIGCSPYATPEFRTAEELISHLDYLGIDRAIVHQQEAIDLNPLWGNRDLQETLAGNSILSSRLGPGFVIAPQMKYENGAMEHLHAAFQNAGPKALIVAPGTSGYPMRHIERVLAELACHNPAIIWNCRDVNGHTDFVEWGELAGKFSKITFICSQVMWKPFGEVLDLMWRQDNICVDTSWLHMRGAIEMLVKEFGPERVLFGTGYRSHYGAAIAALNFADITAEARDKIAHGNAERLFGFEPLGETLYESPSLLSEKPLWARCRNGEKLDTVEIIDAHGHTGPHTRGWFLKDVDMEEHIECLLTHMDRVGIDRLIVTPGTALFGDPVEGSRVMQQAFRKHRDRFSGYIAFNPYYRDELIKQLDDLFADGFFVGFKVLADYWKIPVTDPGYRPAWEYANKARMPILLHTWDGSHDSPAMLRDIAPAYPEAFFLLGHSGGGEKGRREAIELALANDNVRLEFCGSFTTRTDWVDTLDQIGIERVVYGSDTRAHDEAWELGRFLSIPLPDRDLEPALAHNMKMILDRVHV